MTLLAAGLTAKGLLVLMTSFFPRPQVWSTQSRFFELIKCSLGDANDGNKQNISITDLALKLTS